MTDSSKAVKLHTICKAAINMLSESTKNKALKRRDAEQAVLIQEYGLSEGDQRTKINSALVSCVGRVLNSNIIVGITRGQLFPAAFHNSRALVISYIHKFLFYHLSHLTSK